MDKYGKWIIAALSASLMLNVFAAGHLVGGGLRPKPEPQSAAFSRGMPRGVYKAMPETAREAFKKSLLERRSAGRDLRREARALRTSLPDIIAKSGPLDEAALQERFAKLRALNADLQGGFEGALISALKTMNAQERADFAVQLRKTGKKDYRDRRPGEGRNGPPRSE